MADFSSLSRGAIAKIEGRKSNISVNALHLLAEAFHIRPPEFINRIYEQLRIDPEGAAKLEPDKNPVKKRKSPTNS